MVSGPISAVFSAGKNNKSRHFTQEQQAERYLARHGFRAD
nr:MAG TPA: hypothetical protein [Caudoviricetes sp.]